MKCNFTVEKKSWLLIFWTSWLLTSGIHLMQLSIPFFLYVQHFFDRRSETDTLIFIEGLSLKLAGFCWNHLFRVSMQIPDFTLVPRNCMRQEPRIKLIPEPKSVYFCRYNNEGNLDGSHCQQVWLVCFRCNKPTFNRHEFEVPRRLRNL